MAQTLLRGLHLELVQGDDYKAVDTRAITIAGRGVCWASNVSNVKLIVYEPHTACGAQLGNAHTPVAVFDIDGVYTAATTSAAAIAAFDVPRVETLKLSVGVRNYMFEVRALLSSSSVATLAQGVVTVLSSQL